LAVATRFVHRVDGAKLAAVYEHLVGAKRTAVCVRHVSNIHSFRARYSDAPSLVWPHYRLVAYVHVTLYHSPGARRMGILR